MSDLTQVEIEQRDDVVVARLTGELDISVAERTGQRIAEAVPSSARGVVVDISTWDSPGRALQADPKKFVALLGAGVVDTVSTDFGGGAWEPMVKGLAMAVRAQVLTVPAAVALATGNVARCLPELATDRGLLSRGKLADVVCVASDDLAQIRTALLHAGAGRAEDRHRALEDGPHFVIDRHQAIEVGRPRHPPALHRRRPHRPREVSRVHLV